MRTKGTAIGLRALLLALALALAGPSCMHLERSPDPVAAAKKSAGTKGKAKAAPPKSSPKKSAQKKKKPSKKPVAKKKRKSGKKKDELKLNPSRVLSLQLRALEAQNGQEWSSHPRHNRFTRFLDDFHERTYLWMDDAVRMVDMKWLAEDARYDPELSTFKLRTTTRVGGRSSERDFDVKVRFRADVALPGLEQKMHLYLDNAGRDSLPGTDILKQESDPRLGIRAMLRTLKDNELSMGGGLRWRDSNPVVYVGLDWRWQREMGAGRFCLNPRGVYYSDEGFGQKTEITWTRPMRERNLFQIRTAERSSEGLEGVEFEQSFRFAWLRSGKGRGWVMQASVFPHLESSDWIWDDSLVNITWRDALYRKWIYYTVTPQVQFPKEDEYQARPSIQVGLEILFGGKIGDLM